MRCLITGASGFVASHLIDYLLEHTDWSIYGTIRWRSPLDNLSHMLGRINSGDRIRLLYADLRDDASVREAVREASPDYVFHLAAQSYPKTSFAAACDTYEVNVQGTERILNALREFRKDAIIHVCSSSEVYGRVPKEKVPITEDCSFHPASPYAISKVGTDLIGRHYAEAYDMNIQVTRMFTHTGPRRGDVFHESSFAKQIAMIETGQIPPAVHVGNLDSLRTYADVRDAVRAYRMLLTVNPQPGAVYNIGGAHTCTVGETLDYLLSLSDRSIAVHIDQERLRPIDADLQVPDCSRFKAHTGWQPEIPFEKSMQDLLSYWRERVKTQRFLMR